MKRQRYTVGSIVEIPIDHKYYVYAQLLNKHQLIFFDYSVNKPLKDFDVLLDQPVLFFLCVYRDVISQGAWLKVGKLKVKPEFEVLPLQFIQDAMDNTKFELYDPNTGVIKSAKREECAGLESCSVWDAHHVEDRIRAHYAGEACVWVKQIKIV